jgi:hypothetical protein
VFARTDRDAGARAVQEIIATYIDCPVPEVVRLGRTLRTLPLPKTSSVQFRRHARIHAGCRRVDRVCGCRVGRSCPCR